VKQNMITLLATLGLLASLSACAMNSPQRVVTFVDPEIVNNLPARIVLAPFDAPRCTPAEAELLRNALGAELQSLLVSEIVLAPADDANLLLESGLPLRRDFDAEVFINARQKYGADAFVFTSITRYRAYEPPVLGLKVRMFSASTGRLLWASESLMDSTQRDVRRRGERFYNRSALGGNRLYGSDLVFTVPQYYAAFVSSEVVNSFRLQALPPPDADGEVASSDR
jgi:hypothetical protein